MLPYLIRVPSFSDCVKFSHSPLLQELLEEKQTSGVRWADSLLLWLYTCSTT
jgi:hypothetical protein